MSQMYKETEENKTFVPINLQWIL